MMGNYYSSRTWLENREIDVLEQYNFHEEVNEENIHKSQRWILMDLLTKGFLYLQVVNGKNIYQGTCSYLQNFTK